MFYHFPAVPVAPIGDSPLVTVVPYSEKNLAEVYGLFQKVRQQLCEKGQGCFLLPRPAQSFESALKGQDGFVVGAYAPDGGDLVGFCIVRAYDGLAQAYDAKSLTLPSGLGAAHPLLQDRAVAVIQSLCVDGLRAGKKGIAQKLLQAARREVGGARMLAQTGLANLCGIKSFSTAGFIAIGAGTEMSNQWPTPKILLMRMTQTEMAAMKNKIRTTLAPQNPKELYGMQTALYRYLACEGGFVRLHYAPSPQRLQAGLLPVAQVPSLQGPK